MQTARVIDFPVTLKESIRRALCEATNLSKRNAMNNYIKQLFKLCNTNEVKITQAALDGKRIYKLQIIRKLDGELAYDILNHEAVSLDGNCPNCNKHFGFEATILCIHQGLRRHEKAIFACNCGSFYAYHHREED